MDPQSIPVRSDAVKWQVVDDEAILVHVDSGLYFSLNPVGLFIWQNSTGDISCQQIAERIKTEFDVDDATALADLRAFLTSMQTEGLIQLETSSISPTG